MASNNPLKNKKILITCGPTWVPIDSMRVISNRSTGEMGQTLATALQKSGAKVTLLEGPVEHALESKNIRIIKFIFYKDFKKLFKEELKFQYDVVIHAAAVSDYELTKPFGTKISSTIQDLKLELKPTEKLIQNIKRISPNSKLVGFKLSKIISARSAVTQSKALFEDSKCDFVIANNLNKKNYSAFLLNTDQKILAQKKSRATIVQALIQQLKVSI